VSAELLTSDGTALQRTDYTLMARKVRFAAGETSMTFPILISEDAYVEGTETFTVSLSSPNGASVGAQGSTTVQILDDDSSSPTSNPIDDTNIFVRQHYHDFLAREGDAGGISYWANEVSSCLTNLACIHGRRLAVSDAFFVETEYQTTGGFINLVYKTAFGRFPDYGEYMPDRTHLVVGPGLVMTKSDLLNAFVLRSAFTTMYPPSLTNTQYVNMLNANVGNLLTQPERDALIAGLTNATKTRASVLGEVAENPLLKENQYNSVFVYSLYFHYLRRNPDGGGFNFWLGKINAFPPHSLPGQHSLVCAFVTSSEYQERFSSVVTRHNSDCAP
jgi:hypothetical protein